MQTTVKCEFVVGDLLNPQLYIRGRKRFTKKIIVSVHLFRLYGKMLCYNTNNAVVHTWLAILCQTVIKQTIKKFVANLLFALESTRL